MSVKPAFIVAASLSVVLAGALAGPIDRAVGASLFGWNKEEPAAGKARLAQTTPDAPAAPAPAARSAGPAPQVDETALRYFAAQGDQRRLDAEIARLRALYPNWTPPANLNEPANVSDPALDRIWKLYADGRIGEARAAIAERRTSEPAWTPPADLLARLDEAEARERLNNAADLKQWAGVLRIAEETPTLLTCGDVGTMWRVAEAFAETGRMDRARDAYDYVLANCDDAQERLGTIQRAAQHLDREAVDALMGRERTAGGQGEFQAFRDDLLRQRIGEAAEDADAKVSPEDLAAMERLAREGTRADDALSMGWYTLRRGQAAEAIGWFELSRKREESEKAVEGYVTALSQTGRAVEAEPLAHEWRTRSPDNRRAYLNVVTTVLATDPPVRLAPEVLARMTAAISEDRFAPAGQAMGFYALNIGQTATAASWFKTALSWDPQDEASAYGLALTHQRRNERGAFAAVVRDWGPRSPRIALLANPAQRGSTRAPQPIVPGPDGTIAGDAEAEAAAARPRARVSKSMPAEYDAEPAPTTSRRAQVRDAGGGSGVDRGWRLLELNRPVEAIAAFDAVLQTARGQAREDAAYGKSLAQLRLGLTDEAAVSATQAPMTARRGADLQIQILTQRALAAYRAERFTETIIALQERAQYAPEETGLMMVRAWAYFRLRRYDDARRLFEAVARTGNTEGTRGIAAINEATRRVPGAY